MKRLLPFALLLLGLGYLGSTLVPVRNRTAFALDSFGRTPVLSNGRIKPLDTIARTSLLTIQGRQRLRAPDGRTLQPAEWLADVLFAPDKADTYRCILIENTEVLDLLRLRTTDGDGGKRFAYTQVRPQMEELDRQARLAEQTEQTLRTPFQRQAITVRNRVVLYLQLKTSLQIPDSPDFLAEVTAFGRALPAGIAALQARARNQPHSEEAVKVMKEMADRFTYMEQLGYLRPIPPPAGDANAANWRPMGTALLESFASGEVEATARAYATLGHAWRQGDSAQFNGLVERLHTDMAARYPGDMRRSDIEAGFNAAAPFYSSMTLYVLALLAAFGSWLKWPEALGRGAFWLLSLAFAVTTAGLVARMWLEGRPPVTNLYSSALFIGWGAVLLCVFLERMFRNGVGSAAGGAIGFGALLIAHHLALTSGGDTMEMMRAVLDSNFWLGTHVVTITIGYSATYLAGFLAIIYIVMGLFSPWLSRTPTPEGAVLLAASAGSPLLAAAGPTLARRSDTNADMITRMVYGILCFATFFSLVGTVLGGIWADQSWGRFWGWDPKENGALIIVIWNAIILHALAGGMVRQRGLMVMAVFGNIVTSWSWFGTNMLGVGLHSYGFMDGAFYALALFVLTQLALMALALIPLEKWRSFAVSPLAR